MLVAKPDSHKELFEWVEELSSLKEIDQAVWRVVLQKLFRDVER